jgi:GTP pyrophosphokinase
MENEQKTLLPNGGYPMHTFEDIEQIYKIYINDPHDRDLIVRAYKLAAKVHADQKRKSGEPYVHHLLEVAYILANLQVGPSTLAAAFLHDSVEDTDLTVEEIKADFNDDVAKIVESLTKIQRLKLSHRTDIDFEAEDHRKIFLGMAKDVRVILIKLADRLHNMRTLDSLSPERQIALSRETLDVFAPIAHRLGINTIKSELEDLSLKYLKPEAYNQIVQLLDKKKTNRNKSLDALKKRIADILFEHNIPFEIEARVKSIYSIYKKMFVKNHNFEDIYDVLALRIITKTELNCYEILGIIHATYKPIPGRFKDYIAMPKPNMYQSLHTCIVSGDGNIFEIQIRTHEMDEIAETGIAAHWRYKEGTNYNPREEQHQIEEKLHWFRDLVAISNEQDVSANEYMEALSHDIFEANVYVFTPLGKVVDLPSGSTPLDFAYKIHTKVGDQAVGATVNGQMVPLNTILKTGDVVEIKTSKASLGPNAGWLNIAHTASAKSHIRKFLQKKNADLLKDDNIEKGRQSCIDAFKDRGFDEKEMMNFIASDKVLERFGAESVDDLFIMIRSKNPTPAAIIEFLNIGRKQNEIKLDKQSANDDSKCPVDVGNAGKVAVTLGNCCTPIPGDDIVGYITKGKGITIHRINCPNIANEKNRLVSASWKDELGVSTYPVDIQIESSDRNNLLVDVMSTFSQHQVPLTAINAKLHSTTMTTTIYATILVSDSKRLTDIFNVLLNIPSVYEVTRVIH